MLSMFLYWKILQRVQQLTRARHFPVAVYTPKDHHFRKMYIAVLRSTICEDSETVFSDVSKM